MPTMDTKSRGAVLLGGLALGAAAVVAGAMWTTLVQPSAVWSDKQAEEFQAANDALHKAREQKGAGAADVLTPEMLEAQQRFERINSQLESARYAHDRWGTWIAGGGLVLIILCGMGLMATRDGASGSA